jgi:putative transposase
VGALRPASGESAAGQTVCPRLLGPQRDTSTHSTQCLAPTIRAGVAWKVAPATERLRHFVYEPPGGAGNTRNGTSPKTLICEHGKVGIDAPRDRDGSFEPKIVRKRQRRFVGFDEKILALYSRGLSTRDIEAHLQEIYRVKVGRDLISRVTDAVMDDVREWAKRPLEDIYPIVFLDCMVIKIREGGTVQRRALYLALGVTLDGDRDVLGMWFQETEGAKFWMQVLTDLKQRGVRDILICCVDGLTGFPEAIQAIFPKTTVQTCLVHLIRASLKYVPRREREQVARDLKPIYTAKDADQAQAELETFDEKWGARFPVITQAWLNAWEHVIPFLAFPAEVRRVIYTTNAIEALNRQLRKAIKTKGSFPTRTPLASSSTSRCRTRSRNGHGPGTGRRRCSHSSFTSGTASLTLQTDCHTFTATGVTVTLISSRRRHS